MELARGRMQNYQPRSSMHTNVKFKKTGAVIAPQIETVITKNLETIKEKLADANKLCQNYELKFEDVLAEEREEQRKPTRGQSGNIGKLSNEMSYSNAVAARQPKQRSLSARSEIEQDLEQLTQLIRDSFSLELTNTDLRRVATNIAPDETFELSYHELVEFGF